MSLDRCYVCGNLAGWFYWSSSRNFPKAKLLKRMKIRKKGDMKAVYDGERVCQVCYKELMKKE